jgi:hypothetical protein
MTLKTAAQKCSINEELARDIIVRDHELRNLYTKEDFSHLVNMEIDLEPDVSEAISQIACIMKVTEEAVIVSILARQADKALKAASNKKPRKLKKTKSRK